MSEEDISQRQVSNLAYQACSGCQGFGRQQKSFCSLCNGVGLIKPFPYGEGSARKIFYLYWGARVDRLSIYQDRLRRHFRMGLNIACVLLAVSGVLVLFSPIISQLRLENPVDFSVIGENLIMGNGGSLFFFWFTMVTNLYFIFTWQRSHEKMRLVLPKLYDRFDKNARSSQQHEVLSVSWDAIAQISKEEKINVADVYTEEALKYIQKSWQFAKKLNTPHVEPIHLFGMMLESKRSAYIFGRLGIKISDIADKLRKHLFQDTENMLGTGFSLDLKKLFIDAYLEAYQDKQDKVDVDELLIGIAQFHDNIVNEVLYEFDVTEQKLRNVATWLRVNDILSGRVSRFRKKAALRSKSGMDRAMTAIATPFLNQFSTDMTLQAKFGHLQPLVGREREMDEILRIIEGTNEGVILYGQPGVGKTALVEGIASRMVEEDVPKIMQDKRLVSLSVPKLVGGATPADAEQRMLGVIQEIQRAGNIVLFIDNIQDMVGITAGAEGSLDVAEVLASALQRHAFLALATAQEYDYHRYIESHTAIGQILHKVKIEEMSENDAIQVLESKIGFIEFKNKIFFSYDALEEAVQLSGRYMHEKFLPSKALLLVEEEGVYVANERGEGAKVGSEDIAYIVSQKTHIPVTKITEKEGDKLLKLEDMMHKRMVDQEGAVKSIASSLRRARAEFRDTKRPIANFLFLGPTGVGKTECAKTVADVYFGDESNMIRVDMSEYQEKNSIGRLIGAPPAPGGATVGGYLTEAVRKNPFSLILFDEIEKAYPDILTIFLQVMDDGRLTDATGRTIDFTQTIIIMTSNAGTQYIQDEVKKGTSVEQIKTRLLETELKQYFRPEFLNRFDNISVFRPLSMDHVKQIARLMLQKTGKQLEDKGVEFEVTENAINELASEGFDPLFGARPLRRVIQENVNNLLANSVISGKLHRRDKVILVSSNKIDIVKGREL